MKPFVFKLETLLNIRKKREEEANINLSRAKIKLASARELLQSLYDKQTESWDEFRKKQEQGEILVTDFQEWYRFLNFLKEEITNQEQVVERCRQEMLIALHAAEEAMKNRKSVEKLREKRFEQYRIELLQEEQKMLDEIAITRHHKHEGDEA